jgi:hypothetical protein
MGNMGQTFCRQYSSFPYPDRILILEFDSHGETLDAGHIP